MKIDLDHFETIEELERDLIAWIKEEDLYSFDRYLNKEDILKIVQILIKKENIIKEVREYITNQRLHKFQDTTGGLTYNERKLLEILDKGE